MVWKNPQGFTDPCSQAERYPYTAGADALVAYFRQNPAFDVIEATPLQIDGHHAVHLVTRGQDGLRRMPGPGAAPVHAEELRLPLDRRARAAATATTWSTSAPDTLVFELNPADPATDESPITKTLQIPARLPGE